MCELLALKRHKGVESWVARMLPCFEAGDVWAVVPGYVPGDHPDCEVETNGRHDST